MKRFLSIFICSLFFAIPVFGQDETEEAPVKQKPRPVRSPWSSGLLIDNQTSVIYSPKTLEFVIQHKFGSVENGRSDLFGLYAPAHDIRLGLNYVIMRNVQAGWGISKTKMYNDFNLKWTVFEQTREETMPVSVTLFGNMAIDGRSKEFFESRKYNHSSDPDGPFTEHPYRFGQRMSYFSQLIIGRKFNEWLSVQAAASFTHYNLTERNVDHDKIGAHVSGRVKLSPQSSIVFNYDAPLKIKDISEQREFINHPKPNLALGWEVATSTHAFQMYIGSAGSIIPQENMLYNQNDWQDGGLAVGFVITRLWNF
ncbi:MAG: DUF5777 family beta-barrel protein [Bacteroidota bacterium]